MHTVTLRQILEKQPCKSGIIKLLEGLNIAIPLCIEGCYYIILYNKNKDLLFKDLTEEELNKPITLKFILENNGLEHALWCLKIFKESKDWWNLKTDILEIIRPKYEEKYPDDTTFSEAINNIRIFIKTYFNKLIANTDYMYKPLDYRKYFITYSICNLYICVNDLFFKGNLEEEYSEDEAFKTQVTELFIKHFCQEEE